MEQYDAIVVGAGPAGSAAARRLATAGARVLMLDRAAFPREKPCGGGVTFRAEEASGSDLDLVTERHIYGVRISVNRGRTFERRSPNLLARMTQRARLDDHLAGEAQAAGSEFRDGVTVRGVDMEADGATVRTDGGDLRAVCVIGADGVNGVVARSLGLAPAAESAVAFEANYPATNGVMDRWRDCIGLDLGGIPGGYGWVFPKDDHLNVGVGGWKHTGPSLRGRLEKLCAFHGLDPRRLYGHRGYQLPLRRHGSPVVRGTVMLAGDAAALVDPLSGEGIWAALASGRLAAEEAERYLAGQAPDLAGYGRALERLTGDELLASRRLQGVFQRLPNAAILMLKYNTTFWRYLTEIIRGELTYPELPRKLGPLRHVLNAWGDAEARLHERDTRRRARARA
jgi:geranylgeranyl reductase family protein